MRIAIHAAALVLAGVLSIPSAHAMSVEEAAAYQTALIAYIDANSSDGKFRERNPDTGETVALYPANLHPKILDFGRFVVLCADFVDDRGDRVEIDFIADRVSGAPVVREAVLGQRKSLTARLIAEHGPPK